MNIRPAEPDDVGKFLVVNDRLSIPLDEFTFTFMRSSGPGGQNVNKLSTKVRLRWPVNSTNSLESGIKQRFQREYRRRISKEGDCIITSQRFRDQSRNIADCLEKLKLMLIEVAAPPVPRKKTKPSRGAVQRRIKQKQRQSKKKQERRRPQADD